MYEGQEKTAAANILTSLPAKVLLASVAIGAAGEIGQDVYTAVKLKKGQSDAYKNMFKKVPQLKEYDKTKVDDYYNVVKQFAPSMAANPHVAGNLVNNMILNEGVDSQLIQQMAKSQSLMKAEKITLPGTILEKGISGFIPGAGALYPGAK